MYVVRDSESPCVPNEQGVDRWVSPHKKLERQPRGPVFDGTP